MLVFDWLSASFAQKLDHILAFSCLHHKLFILNLFPLCQLLKVVFGAATLLLLRLEHVGEEEASQLTLVLYTDALLGVGELLLPLLLVIDLLLESSRVDVMRDLSIAIILQAVFGFVRLAQLEDLLIFLALKQIIKKCFLLLQIHPVKIVFRHAIFEQNLV